VFFFLESPDDSKYEYIYAINMFALIHGVIRAARAFLTWESCDLSRGLLLQKGLKTSLLQDVFARRPPERRQEDLVVTLSPDDLADSERLRRAVLSVPGPIWP
jgi:hypothetical protein